MNSFAHVLLRAALALNAPVVDAPQPGGLVCTLAVQFSGTASTAGCSDSVTVSVDGLTGSSPVSSSGGWSTTVNLTDAGVYTASVTATEVQPIVVACPGASVTSPAQLVTFTVETHAPPLSVAVPSGFG
jgi:hypothetical protein